MAPESNDFSRKQLEKLEGGKILQTGLEGQERFGLIGDISGRHCKEVRKAKVVCKWFHADEWAGRKSRVWEETGRRGFPTISGGRNGCDRRSWVCLETLNLQRLPHSLRWRTHAFGCEKGLSTKGIYQEATLQGISVSVSVSLPFSLENSPSSLPAFSPWRTFSVPHPLLSQQFPGVGCV